jgi:hypothetical protein
MFAASFRGNNEANLGIIWILYWQNQKNHPKKEKDRFFVTFAA